MKPLPDVKTAFSVVSREESNKKMDLLLFCLTRVALLQLFLGKLMITGNLKAEIRIWSVKIMV